MNTERNTSSYRVIYQDGVVGIDTQTSAKAAAKAAEKWNAATSIEAFKIRRVLTTETDPREVWSRG